MRRRWAPAPWPQAKEQFFPLLSYRTGPTRPERCHGPTWQAGLSEDDQRPRWRHQRREAAFEECETGYDTDRGVECYERLKSRPA